MTPHMVAEDMVILVLAVALLVVAVVPALQAEVIEDIIGIRVTTTTITLL